MTYVWNFWSLSIFLHLAILYTCRTKNENTASMKSLTSQQLRVWEPEFKPLSYNAGKEFKPLSYHAGKEFKPLSYHAGTEFKLLSCHAGTEFKPISYNAGTEFKPLSDHAGTGSDKTIATSTGLGKPAHTFSLTKLYTVGQLTKFVSWYTQNW
jgi:hypothetical protein